MSEEALKAGARLFAAAIEHMNEGYDWDGCDLQDACKKAGLTYERAYDPATDEDLDGEEGDTVWVPTHLGKMLLSLARENGGAK